MNNVQFSTNRYESPREAAFSVLVANHLNVHLIFQSTWCSRQIYWVQSTSIGWSLSVDRLQSNICMYVLTDQYVCALETACVIFFLLSRNPHNLHSMHAADLTISKRTACNHIYTNKIVCLATTFKLLYSGKASKNKIRRSERKIIF